jgi:hypothetical protein
VSGFEVAAGIGALFFVCGILTGVLGVMALSAMRDHRGRAAWRRYASRYTQDQAGTLDWTWPRRPSGPDWEDRPGWQEQRRPGESDDAPPPWPGRRG